MATGFAAVPAGDSYTLANATVPASLVEGLAGTPDSEGLLRADIAIAGGRIASIAPAAAGNTPNASGQSVRVELDGGMVLPCFVDMHTHLDKGHIWPRSPNVDGTFLGAIHANTADRDAHWSAEDIAARMDFSLRTAYAHGTRAIRTHLDSDNPQHRITWPLFAEMREKWAGRIDLQAVSIVGVEGLRDDAYAEELADMVAEHGGILGAALYPVPDLDRLLERLMHRAANRGLDLDFHADESGNPAAATLRAVAETALRTDFPGRIVAGHCCSLAVQPEAEAEATMARVADAGIAVVSLPMCNMYLQNREPAQPLRTPRWRGVTLLHELARHGVPVAVASDNTRDPFYAYGDMDMLEVFREAVRILHLDHPIAPWIDIITRAPAAIIGLPQYGTLAPGASADLVLTRARSYTELLSRPQADRSVIRGGRAIDTTLPDYRELDGPSRT